MNSSEGVPSALSVREAREQLCQLLRTFREQAEDADPVYVGQRRQPEAVVLSVEKFMQLALWAERGMHFRWYFEPERE